MVVQSFKNISPTVGEKVLIHESAVVIGDVVLGDDCSVWPTTVIRGDVHYIRIGKRSNIQDGSVLHVTHYGEYNPTGFPLLIGEEVTIGHRVIAHACTIGNRCLIGMGSILLDGAFVEDDVMLGAGSLVSPGKRLESGYLYFGQPAKKIRALTRDEIKFLKYSAQHYCALKDSYL